MILAFIRLWLKTDWKVGPESAGLCSQALRRLRQKDGKFKASGLPDRSCDRKTTQKAAGRRETRGDVSVTVCLPCLRPWVQPLIVQCGVS